MLVRAVESVTAGRENSSEVEPDVLTWPYGGIGGMCNLVAGLMLGRHTTILDKFNVDEWVAAVRQRQPSIASGPPAVARMVLDAQVPPEDRSEEHTSELQSLMRSSYAVFCLKKNIQQQMSTTRRHAHNN